jgi:protein phosphatase
MRENNEDSVFPENSGRTNGQLVVAVADGMGGHIGGEVASRLAIDTLATRTNMPIPQRIAVANDLILKEATENPDLRGMGTTVTAAELMPKGAVTIGHVGDSRAYLFREGQLAQITKDHSVVAEYLRAGSIQPEDVATHPQRSMLTRAVGLDPDLVVDVVDIGVMEGDRLLICSDGLTSMIADGQIAELLGSRNLEEAVWVLIEAANRAGGHDNITLAVVDVGP